MRAMLGLLLITATCPVIGATVSEGRSAYNQNRVAEAERIYGTIAADRTASASERSAAERELARVAWLIDGEADDALRHLDAARQFGEKPCDTAAMAARVLREARRYEEALGQSDTLVGTCAEVDARDAILIQLIGARLDLAAANSARRVRLLQEAAAEASRLGPNAGLEGDRVRLEIGLLNANADAALDAWRDYFWLEEMDAPQALEGRDAAGTFAAGLRSIASDEERLRLADLLVRAGFSEPARRYAAANGLPGSLARSPAWRRLEVYWQQRERLEATLLRVNRGLARGRRDETALANIQNEATAALLAAAGASGDPRTALLEHYGLFGTDPGQTGGYPGIHLGHVAEDRRDRVSQYGHSAEFRFIAVDNMIANGFQSWLWDGSSAVGGWATDAAIVQVRSGYVQSPINRERLRQDSVSRRELIGRQSTRAAEDLAKLKTRPVATLSGLNDRLTLQLVDRLEAAVRSRVTTEEEVRAAFLAEYWRASFNQSMQTHEGRHAIDYVVGVDKNDQLTLEYRAKLSELALADYPRMALRAINSNLEGDSPHDRAGARIFDEYRQWIESNGNRVIGYDPAVPALVQLDKLTDNQIREVARGLDPLAQASASAARP